MNYTIYMSAKGASAKTYASVLFEEFVITYYDKDGTTLLGTERLSKNADLDADGTMKRKIAYAPGYEFGGWVDLSTGIMSPLQPLLPALKQPNAGAHSGLLISIRTEKQSFLKRSLWTGRYWIKTKRLRIMCRARQTMSLTAGLMRAEFLSRTAGIAI